MKFIGAHIFDYDATFRSNVNVTGNLDVDGTINIDAADIDGNLQLDGTLTVGVDDTGYDVKFFGATSGKYLLWDQSDNNLEFADGVGASFGTNAYFNIQNNGTKTSLVNNTGNVEFRQTADDADIIFKCDDGSGGDTAYITLDGSAGYTIASKNINWLDSVYATWGASGDLQILHNGSNSFIDQTGTGDLYIRQKTDDKDIIFQSDDGSGGVATYMTVDGSAEEIVVSKPLHLNFGNSNQLKITAGNVAHDAAIDLDTGDSNGQWRIKAEGSDETFQISNVDQGGTSPLSIHPTTKTTTLAGPLTVGVDDTGHDVIFYGATSDRYMMWDESYDGLIFTDNTKLQLGSSTGSGDMQLVHNGTNSYIKNNVGDLYIYNHADDKDIIFQCDDGSGSLATYFFLDGSSGSDPRTVFPDSSSLYFGTDQDLQLRHNGTNSIISNSAGALQFYQYVDDDDIVFFCDDGSGGNTIYLRIDGSASTVTFPNDISATFGTSRRLIVKHDGTDALIRETYGDLKIENTADDKDIILKSDDGSGGTTAYLTLDGSENEIHFHKPVGIGTTNPDTTYKLDVAGKVQVQSVLELDDVLTLNAISTPADPAAGKSSIYMDSSDGAIRVKINVGGTVVTRTIASYE